MNLEPIKARLAAATEGPWEHGNRYSTAGVMSQFGEDKCCYCVNDRPGRLVFSGRMNINGHMMMAHTHERPEVWSETGIYHFDGEENASVVTETDEYGLMNDADATLIAHAPTDIAELVAEVERLQAVIDMLDKLMDPDYYRFASAGDVLSDLSAVLKMKEEE